MILNKWNEIKPDGIRLDHFKTYENVIKEKLWFNIVPQPTA